MAPAKLVLGVLIAAVILPAGAHAYLPGPGRAILRASVASSADVAASAPRAVPLAIATPAPTVAPKILAAPRAATRSTSPAPAPRAATSAPRQDLPPVGPPDLHGYPEGVGGPAGITPASSARG